jgi:hypothetical protein
VWLRRPAADADVTSVGSTLGEENVTTWHKGMTLLKRKVTAQVAENRSC